MKYLLVLLVYTAGPYPPAGYSTIPMPVPMSAVGIIQQPYSSLQKCEEAGTNWNHAGMTFICLQAPQEE